MKSWNNKRLLFGVGEKEQQENHVNKERNMLNNDNAISPRIPAISARLDLKKDGVVGTPRALMILGR